MVEFSNPTRTRRQLAAELRQARQHNDLTIEDVAGHLLCSTAKISRIETGQRAASLRDVRDLCELYSIAGDDRDRLMTWAEEARQRGWWESYDIPPTYASYIGLESVASSIRDFKSSIVSGFLQTESYVRSLLASWFTEPDQVVIDGFTEVRMKRQKALLAGPTPPSLHVVLDEAALHHEIGGPTVMREQLGWLLDIVRDLPAVELQIVPFVAGAYPGVDCTFTILDFDEESLPSALMVEDVTDSFKPDHSAELAKAEHIFQKSVDAALSTEESLKLISRVRDGYST